MVTRPLIQLRTDPAHEHPVRMVRNYVGKLLAIENFDMGFSLVQRCYPPRDFNIHHAHGTVYAFSGGMKGPVVPNGHMKQ
jgi:hypothetical protein